jgi:hypothetical protein
MAILAVTHLTVHSEEKDFFPCMRITRMQKCIAVPLASIEQDQRAKAFDPPSDGTAHIYVARPYTTNQFQTTTLHLNGKPVGVLGPLTYAVLNVPPGRHRVTTFANGKTDVELEVTAGKVFFIQYSIEVLFNTSTDMLILVDDQKGRELVSKTKKIIQ